MQLRILSFLLSFLPFFLPSLPRSFLPFSLLSFLALLRPMGRPSLPWRTINCREKFKMKPMNPLIFHNTFLRLIFPFSFFLNSRLFSWRGGSLIKFVCSGTDLLSTAILLHSIPTALSDSERLLQGICLTLSSPLHLLFLFLLPCKQRCGSGSGSDGSDSFQRKRKRKQIKINRFRNPVYNIGIYNLNRNFIGPIHFLTEVILDIVQLYSTP